MSILGLMIFEKGVLSCNNFSLISEVTLLDAGVLALWSVRSAEFLFELSRPIVAALGGSNS
jgi:hypothetical protein